jgi:hypothetical protein
MKRNDYQQLELPLTPAQAKEQSLAQVEKHADLAWLGAAISVLNGLCRRRESLTADAVWLELDSAGLSTHEPRAMGAVFQHGKNKKWCAPTSQFVPSKRPVHHAGPIRVWRSLIQGEEK